MTSPSDIPNVGDLQVDQDMRFHSRMWRIQRAGWAVFVIIILAALAGLMGDGPLANATVRSSNELEVRYGRIERHRSPSTLVVLVSTEAAENGVVEVWLDREFADRLRIETVTPEPESVQTSATRITYTFEVDEEQPFARLSFAVTHQGIGSQRGAVGIADGPAVSFGQLVLP